jgi:hypothetical protein
MLLVATMRVVILSLGAVLILFISVLITRFWGQGQQFVDFQHPFFQAASPLYIIKAKQESDIDEALTAQPLAGIWLDVETTLDKKVIVFTRDFSEKELSMEAYRGPKSMAYDFQRLKNIRPEIKELKEVIAQYPQQHFILNILDNVENVHVAITQALKGLHAEKRILLQSNFNIVMSSIKELEPFWLYGCSQADLMRFLTFESMWVLPAAPFKGDVFISPYKLMNREAFNEEILQDVRRRKKKIVLGPILQRTDFADALRLKADGIVIENLADFLAWTRP